MVAGMAEVFKAIFIRGGKAAREIFLIRGENINGKYLAFADSWKGITGEVDAD